MIGKPALARLLAATLLFALAGEPGRAVQDGNGQAWAETEAELDAMLWERDRELLHRGTPLEVAGLERGDNAFRAGTPALVRTDARPALVDLEELHRRKLAMHSERATFHTPLGVGAGPGHGPARAGAPADGERNPAAVDAGARSGPSSTSALFGLLTLVMAFLVAWRARQGLA